MQTFVVIVTESGDASVVGEAVARAYVGAHLDVTKTVWFVADRGVTAEEVCQKLGVRRSNPPADGLDGVVVLKYDDYFGHASGSVWKWIEEKRKVS